MEVKVLRAASGDDALPPRANGALQVSKKILKCDETPSWTCYKRYGRFQCFHSVSVDTSES